MIVVAAFSAMIAEAMVAKGLAAAVEAFVETFWMPPAVAPLASTVASTPEGET